MMRIFGHIVAVLAVTILIAAEVQADATWYTISFTGADMFNYTTTVDELYNQDAPRRVRDWPAGDGPANWIKWSDMDSNGDGTNDFADWAGDNLDSYGFSYFNLWGETIAPDYWDQPYQAVPDQGDGKYGVESWRNQTFPEGWTGGIVMANQTYNSTDHAFPVWRAPEGQQLTMGNAASLVFSVDVLMQNPDTAFEPDGTLRVWFGGFDQPQDWTGATTEVSGIMLVPLPAAVLLGVLGLGAAGLKLRKYA